VLAVAAVVQRGFVFQMVQAALEVVETEGCKQLRLLAILAQSILVVVVVVVGKLVLLAALEATAALAL
jgi:hypothetical protein